MKRPGLGTYVSIAMNFVLALWLTNNYFYDEFFRTYVDLTLTQIYPFLIVTLGLGGGSGLGYFLLKRRQHEHGALDSLQKARTLRKGNLQATTASSPQLKVTSPAVTAVPTTKHTAYAVPPLSRAPTSSPSRSAPSTSWSTGAAANRQFPPASPPASTPPQRSIQSSAMQRQSSSIPVPQMLKPESAKSAVSNSASGFRTDQEGSSQPSATSNSSTGSTASIPSQQWKTSEFLTERRVESPGPFPKPGLEFPPKTDNSVGPSKFTATPPPEVGTLTPNLPKWQSLATQDKPSQWVDPVPRQGFSPQKWVPAPGTRPDPRQQPPPTGGVPVRTGPFPPQRSPFGQSQPPPRPLTYPGAVRPGSNVPLGPVPFRSTQPGPPRVGMPTDRVTIPGQRPPPSQPGRQPLPPSPTQNRPQPGSGTVEKELSQTKTPELQPPTSTETRPGPESTSMGEMDWDTALDTILKTLRKDKLVER